MVPAMSKQSNKLTRALPMVKFGPKALGLLHPINNKTYEFVLANGEKCLEKMTRKLLDGVWG
jgi:hypothetical protein